MKASVKKPIPFLFVLDELESLDPVVRPLFGCQAIYLGEKIVLVLRDKDSERQDNGVWIATSSEHHPSLKREFPSMRSIQLLGNGRKNSQTNWQVLPVDAEDFEESAMRACALVRAQDERIGRIPKARKKKVASPTARRKKAPKSRRG